MFIACDLLKCFGAMIGTKGFSDSGESGLGETGGGSSGAVPVEKGL